MRNSTSVHGCASFRIARKLKAIKNAVKTWAKEKIEKDKMESNDILEEIDGLDYKEGVDRLSDDDRARRDYLKVKLATILKVEETSWRQNSREK